MIARDQRDKEKALRESVDLFGWKGAQCRSVCEEVQPHKALNGEFVSCSDFLLTENGGSVPRLPKNSVVVVVERHDQF
jgi:hypothetical protein